MPTSREKIREILASNEFTEGEKFVVRAQYREAIPMGNFEEKLWELLCAASLVNQTRIALAFPDEANAVAAWQHGDLGMRLRAAGLVI